MVELAYAGVFRFLNVPQEQVHPLLMKAATAKASGGGGQVLKGVTAQAGAEAILKLLIEEGVMDRRMLQNITHEIDEEVQQATVEAMRDNPPAAASALRHLYSDKVDATSDGFAVEPHFLGAPKRTLRLRRAPAQPAAPMRRARW